MEVTIGEYVFVQAKNNHVHGIKGDMLVYHGAVTEKLTEEQLREYGRFVIDNFLEKGRANK